MGPLRLVHSQEISRCHIELMLERAESELRNACVLNLSTARRFECAYHAALLASRAYAGELNAACSSGGHQEVMGYACRGLGVGSSERLSLEVRQHRLEQSLARAGGSAVTPSVADRTYQWSLELNRAVRAWFSANRPARLVRKHNPPRERTKLRAIR